MMYSKELLTHIKALSCDLIQPHPELTKKIPKRKKSPWDTKPSFCVTITFHDIVHTYLSPWGVNTSVFLRMTSSGWGGGGGGGDWFELISWCYQQMLS